MLIAVSLTGGNLVLFAIRATLRLHESERSLINAKAGFNCLAYQGFRIYIAAQMAVQVAAFGHAQHKRFEVGWILACNFKQSRCSLLVLTSASRSHSRARLRVRGR